MTVHLPQNPAAALSDQIESPTVHFDPNIEEIQDNESLSPVTMQDNPDSSHYGLGPLADPDYDSDYDVYTQADRLELLETIVRHIIHIFSQLNTKYFLGHTAALRRARYTAN